MTVESSSPTRTAMRYNEAGQLAPPSSPSKRNGRYNDDRPKKHRVGLLALGDRKDTPAPSTFGTAHASAPRLVPGSSSNVAPATSAAPSSSQSNLLPSGFAVGGGEAARRAAASSNYLPQQGFYQNPSWQTSETSDLRMSWGKQRVSSIGSAADSGADLSVYARSSQDSDGDVEMLDSAAKKEKEVKRWGIDFVTVLPEEINLQIFEMLDAEDLRQAQHITRRWCRLANMTSVWRSIFLRKWGREIHTDPAPIQVGGQGVGVPNKPNQKWQRMHEAREELEKNWRRGQRDAGKATYLAGHTDSVYCVQFDEEKIITGSRDRTIRVWDMNTMQCLRVIGGPNVRPVPGPKPLRTVDYPSFHNAVASVNGSPYGNSIFQTPSQWHDASILCLQYDDEILVTGSSDSDLLIWDIHTYEPIHRLRKHTGGVLDVALDAKHIVSCSKDSRIIVWDRKTFEPVGVLSGHRGPVNAVQLRGKMLVSASGDGIARLWDLEQMKLVKEFTAKERGLAAVEFSEDMKYVLAGGNDHVTYKFDVATGAEVGQFLGHSQLVRSLWLDSANQRVVSGSYDLDLRVYDFETGEEVWRAEEWTTSWMLAAKSDYRRIVATSQDGRILVVDFGLKKGGREDGMPIDNVDLLRAIPIEQSSAIVFRNPFAVDSPMLQPSFIGRGGPSSHQGSFASQGPFGRGL